jgi:hypothetical protein
MERPIAEIHITAKDFEPYVDYRALEQINGTPTTATLGTTGEEVRAILANALPRLVTDKLKDLIPSDFILAEVAFSMKVSGNVGLAAIDGTVNLKLTPKRD